MWAGPLLLNLAGAAVELEDANTEVVEVEETEVEQALALDNRSDLIRGIQATSPELDDADLGGAIINPNGEALMDLGQEALVVLGVGALVDLGGEAQEGLGELRPNPPQRRRGISVTWWEDSTAETLSEPDTYTEPTLDSEDGSLSSTRASTSAATTGTTSRPSQRSSMRSFSVVVRGGRSPNSLLRGLAHTGYRGRSVTRRERRMPNAALRHRHPTHTPSRGPARRGPVLADVHPVGAEPAVLLRHRFGAPLAHVGFHHRIGRVREDQAEGGS